MVSDRRAHHLTTWYDDEHGPDLPELPALLTSGQDPALIVDGLARRSKVLGRCLSSPAVIGVRVPPVDHAVRCTLQLLMNRHTTDWWDRSVDERIPRAQARLPRLVLICAQRRLRRAVLLARSGKAGARRATVSFELAPGEIPADGLVLVELWGAMEWTAPFRDEAAPRLAPCAPIGLLVRSLAIEPVGTASGDGAADSDPADSSASASATASAATGVLSGRAGERLGLVSTGGLPVRKPAKRRRPQTGRLLVVNPAGDHSGAAPVRLILDPVIELPEGGRWRRLRHRLKHRLRAKVDRMTSARSLPVLSARARLPVGLSLRAVGIGDGRTVPLLTEFRDGRYEVTVPATGGPVLVMSVPPGPGARPARWRLVATHG